MRPRHSLRYALLIPTVLVVATAANTTTANPSPVVGALRQTAGPRHAISATRRPEYSVDTVSNVLLKRGNRPVALSHPTAVRMFFLFGQMNATDAWLEKLKSHQAYLLGKARFESAGFVVPISRAHAAHQPTGPGLRLSSAAATGHLSSRPGGAFRYDRRASAFTGKIGATALSRLTEASAAHSADGFSAVKGFGIEDAETGTVAATAEVSAPVTGDDYCLAVEQQIYAATAQYAADQVTYWAKQDSVQEELTTKGKASTEDGAELVADGVILIQDNTALNYWAVEFNLNNCVEGDYIDTLDESFVEAYQYTDDSGASCDDELWEIDISYDGGETWEFYQEVNITNCNGDLT